MAVGARESAEALEVGLPTTLFPLPSAAVGRDQYAVSADGQRFLVKVQTGGEDTRLHVILNWTSLLE